MIARQNYQSLRSVIEFLSICQQLKLVKHTNLQGHFVHIVELSKTGVVICPVDKPQVDHIRVAYNKV